MTGSQILHPLDTYKNKSLQKKEQLQIICSPEGHKNGSKGLLGPELPRTPGIFESDSDRCSCDQMGSPQPRGVRLQYPTASTVSRSDPQTDLDPYAAYRSKGLPRARASALPHSYQPTSLQPTKASSGLPVNDDSTTKPPRGSPRIPPAAPDSTTTRPPTRRTFPKSIRTAPESRSPVVSQTAPTPANLADLPFCPTLQPIVSPLADARHHSIRMMTSPPAAILPSPPPALAMPPPPSPPSGVMGGHLYHHSMPPVLWGTPLLMFPFNPPLQVPIIRPLTNDQQFPTPDDNCGTRLTAPLPDFPPPHHSWSCGFKPLPINRTTPTTQIPQSEKSTRLLPLQRNRIRDHAPPTLSNPGRGAGEKEPSAHSRPCNPAR